MVMRSLIKITFLLLFVGWLNPAPTIAQPITAAEDGTGTSISSPEGDVNQYDIEGGTLSGENLFHSFEQFGLDAGQVANFLSNPDISNILGRVVGGDASLINGLIQMSGGASNLFLVNPAGIVLGPNAQFNLPADFTATTANGIQIGDEWLSSLGSNDYATLMGQPGGFAFTVDSPGTILNAGNITAASGSSIRLVGGTVVNTGSISTPGGEIVIEAVPEAGLVMISPEGSLLSLGVPMATQADVNGGVVPLTALALPELLSKDGLDSAMVAVVEDGVVRLTRTNESAVIPPDAGVAITSGSLDVSNSVGVGGNIDVLGDHVSLINARLNASGENGGTVRIGGGYQGQEAVPNAEQTTVSRNTRIVADALSNGDGGRAIFWADGNTNFEGSVSARGGSIAGDGGFVEVSGRQNLGYDGSVNVGAANGKLGTLLLDPTNVLIANSSSSDRFDRVITPASITQTIGEVELEATNDIVVGDGVFLGFNAEGGAITFTADSDSNGNGAFLVGESTTIDALETSNQRIVTRGRDITISGASIVAGNFVTRGTTDQNGGNISLTSTRGNTIIGYIDARGDDSGRIETTGGDISIDANRLFRATRFVPDPFLPGSTLPDFGNTTGPVSLYTSGTIDDSSTGLTNGGSITIAHGGNEPLVVLARTNTEDLLADPGSTQLSFLPNPQRMFEDNDSGTLGAILSRTDNGSSRAIYQDELSGENVIASNTGLTGVIEVSRSDPNPDPNPSPNPNPNPNPNPDSNPNPDPDPEPDPDPDSDPNLDPDPTDNGEKSSSGTEGSNESDSEESEPEEDLCKAFESGDTLDVSSIAPEECEE